MKKNRIFHSIPQRVHRGEFSLRNVHSHDHVLLNRDLLPNIESLD